MCLGNYYQRAKLDKIMKMYKLSSKKGSGAEVRG